MSIDLAVTPIYPVSVERLLPKISGTLMALLGVSTMPPLTLARREKGEDLPVVTDTVGVERSPLLLISISGEPETISLSGDSHQVTVSMSGHRSPLMYALGAAVAITLAREVGGALWDDRQFFDNNIHMSPDVLFEHMRVRTAQSDFREAAQQLRWGPSGAQD